MSEAWCDGDRHGWLAKFCPALARVRTGRDAGELLNGSLPDGEGAVVLLPMWRWDHAVIDVGRKALSYDGGRVLLPVRLDWGGPLVRVLPPGTHDLRWRAVGLGHTSTGAVRVEVSGYGYDATQVPPESSLVRAGTVHRPADLLAELAEAGHETFFRLVTPDSGREESSLLVPYVNHEIERAHAHLARQAAELAGRPVPGSEAPPPLMDDAGFDQVRDALLLGKPREEARTRSQAQTWDQREVSPLIQNLIISCTEHDFARVDPELYVRRAIHRDAADVVRRYLGDATDGPRIRRLALDLGVEAPRLHPDVVDEVLAAYADQVRTVNRRHIESALSVVELSGAIGQAYRDS